MAPCGYPTARCGLRSNSLQDAGASARVKLLDGLYPPRLIASLRELGLVLVSEHPLQLLPLDYAALPDRSSIGARPALGKADEDAWRALSGIADPAPAGAHDWLMIWDGEVAAAARFGAVGGRAARLNRWRGVGAAEEPTIARLLLTAACASSALGADLLFGETASADERASLLALGFRDTGAVLTFEEVS